MSEFKAVPNYIRRFRDAHGITATELADALGAHQTTVSKWESRTNEVSDDFKLRLAGYFNVPVTALFDFGYEPLSDALRRTIEVVASLRQRVDGLDAELEALRTEKVAS